MEMNQPLGSSYLTAKGLNLLKESECCASVQIVLCSYLQINNIQRIIQFLFVLFPLLLYLHQQHVKFENSFDISCDLSNIILDANIRTIH